MRAIGYIHVNISRELALSCFLYLVFKECAAEGQNWLCLHCGAVNCGRYVNGHAKLHAETSDHQLCMSCDVYSVYW